MIAVRTIRSEDELRAVAADSLVCPAYHPESVYQAGGDGTFGEPGEKQWMPVPALWEWATGAYETQVLDEDREMWVLWDAAAPRLTRPPRGADSPDWMSLVPGRTPKMIAHMSRDDAAETLEEALRCPPTDETPNPGAHVSLWRRTKERRDFYLVSSTPQGTAQGEHSWIPVEPQ